MNGNQNEFAKGFGLVRQFCEGIGVDSSAVMSKGRTGIVAFTLNKSLPAGKQMPVNIMLVPEASEREPARIVVNSPITAFDNIPARSREEFFRVLLEENAKVDTACICISHDSFITAKADRILKGLDAHELNDMAMIVVGLAGRLHLDLCPRFSIKTIIEGEEGIPISVSQEKESAPKQPAASAPPMPAKPADVLAEIQRFAVKVIDKGEALIQAGNHAQCFRVYYDAAFKVSALLKTKVKGVPLLDALRSAIGRAMSETQVTDGDERKCIIMRHVFDDILQLKV